MHVGLWVIQVFLSVVFVFIGLIHTIVPIEEVIRLVPLFADFHPRLVRYIGTAELTGAMGLILPGLTGIQPGLTSWAAKGLATIMVFAIGVHVSRGEFVVAVLPLVLFALALFVAHGRRLNDGE